MKLPNPIGQVVEVDLTDLYVDTLIQIYESYKQFGSDPSERADEIFNILNQFDSMLYAMGVVGEEDE